MSKVSHLKLKEINAAIKIQAWIRGCKVRSKFRQAQQEYTKIFNSLEMKPQDLEFRGFFLTPLAKPKQLKVP